MSDYVDTVDIEGTQYSIQDTPTKEQTEENAQKIEELENLDIYSLEEIQTAGRWINNKPIYRKVIHYQQAFPEGNNSIPTGINNIDFMVNIDCIFMNNEGHSWFRPLINRTLTAIRNVYYQKSDNTLHVDSIGILPSYSQTYFILEYTKTTD